METSTTIVQSNVDQSLNPTSPYYLHPGENPCLVLVTLSLNETNYWSWSRNMKRALLSNNKLKIIKEAMVKLLNKMLLLRENTNTF